MRIGLLANTFDPLFGAQAGGHVHFIQVAKRWRNVDIVVFGPEIARSTIINELPEAAFVAMPSGRRIHNLQLRNLFRTLASFYRRRELRSCDLLVATSHFIPDTVPALFAKRGRMIVCVQHILRPARERPGPRLPNSISSFFQSFSFFLVRRFAPAIFVNSLSTATAIRIDPSKTKTYVMTHGIDHLPTRLNSAPEGMSALYLGRLVPTKGVDDLIKAWQLVVTRLPNATLTIAGGGSAEYTRSLVELANKCGITTSICFAGRITDDEKQTLFAKASIFVFASKEEGWGIAIAEAMANGLPCVAYDLPAYHDVFVSGILVAPLGDYNSFAQLIVDVMDSAPMRDRLANEAIELSRTFSWRAAADIEYAAICETLA